MVINIAFIVVVVHTTIFDYITITENLISCNSTIDYKNFTDYASFIIKKISIEVIIIFVVEEVTA